IAATPDVSVVTAPVIASTPQASTPTPAPAATIGAPTPAPELAAATAQQPVVESAESGAPSATTATNATPATVLAPEKVGQFAPSPSFGERLNSFTGQRPVLVWVLGLSGLGLLVSVVAMEIRKIRRRIGATQIGHRPATV